MGSPRVRAGTRALRTVGAGGSDRDRRLPGSPPHLGRGELSVPRPVAEVEGVVLSIVGERTIGGILRERAQEMPDKRFLLYESAAGECSTYTYSELDTAVQGAEHAL